jgi:Zn-dependent protease
MDNEKIRSIILITPIILLSLSIHEFAHALIAYRFGDNTAKQEGRLTLNPLAHLDPMGTLMLYLSYFTGVGLGWAKPVPVNSRYFREPLKAMLWVSLAGPCSNFLLALFFGLPIRLINLGLLPLLDQEILILFLEIGMWINLSLGLFNLLPIPPLDGSKVLKYFLRGRWFELMARLEQYGFMILLGIVILVPDFLGYVIYYPRRILVYLITGV